MYTTPPPGGAPATRQVAASVRGRIRRRVTAPGLAGGRENRRRPKARRRRSKAADTAKRKEKEKVKEKEKEEEEKRNGEGRH